MLPQYYGEPVLLPQGNSQKKNVLNFFNDDIIMT